MLHRAVFFDRDGTLNLDPGYLGDPEKVNLYKGVPEVIKKLKDEFGFKIIVISNQSGISRGYITKEDVEAVNEKINELLKQHNTSIDAFYFCPYHPEFNSSEKVSCRKPSPEMVFNAAQDFNIDLSRSYFVGDKLSDVQCGANAGTKTVLIRSEITKEEILSLLK